MNHKSALMLSMVLLSCGLAGCYTDAPYDKENNYGAAVRNMVIGQIHDPAAAANPPAQAPQGLDGPAASQAMKTYREPPPKAKRTSDPVLLNITQ